MLVGTLLPTAEARRGQSFESLTASEQQHHYTIHNKNPSHSLIINIPVLPMRILKDFKPSEVFPSAEMYTPGTTGIHASLSSRFT